MTDSERERLRLVELERESTNDFVKGVVTTGATLRGAGITIWLALVGFAIQQHLWLLALLAAVVALVFLILDGYHGWLYAEASGHAAALEGLLAIYYAALSRGDDDPDAWNDFRTKLRAHRFGLFSNLRDQFSPKKLWSARPHVFYRGLYPALVVIAAAAAVLVGTGVVSSGTSAHTAQSEPVNCAAYYLTLDQLADDEPGVANTWPAPRLDAVAVRCGFTNRAIFARFMRSLATK